MHYKEENNKRINNKILKENTAAWKEWLNDEVKSFA
jgi:hypothetical protein